MTELLRRPHPASPAGVPAEGVSCPVSVSEIRGEKLAVKPRSPTSSHVESNHDFVAVLNDVVFAFNVL